MDRRSFLWNWGGGLGGIALASLMGRDALGQSRPEFNGGLHHRAKAKRVVQLFMSGAASQCDTFDYKPRLIQQARPEVGPRRKGRAVPDRPGRRPCRARGSGGSTAQCGKWVSDLRAAYRPRAWTTSPSSTRWSASPTSTVPRRSCRTPDSFCPVFPARAVGCPTRWECERESADVRRPARCARLATEWAGNWGSGFLPAAHQATTIRVGTPNPIARPVHRPHPRNSLRTKANGMGWRCSRRSIATTTPSAPGRLAPGRTHCFLRDGRPAAVERTRSAGSFKRVRGDEETLRLGCTPITADFGQRCLVARRLLERGVRFVQVWSGADNGFPRRNWDSHEDIAKDHGDMAAGMDQPAAGASQGPQSTRPARRHHRLLDDRVRPHALQPGRQGPRPQSLRLHVVAGGRRRQRRASPTVQAMNGRTRRSITRPTATTCTPRFCICWASITRKLTFRHNGIDRRLTDVHGHVIQQVVA